jgi:hypothetical protein
MSALAFLAATAFASAQEPAAGGPGAKVGRQGDPNPQAAGPHDEVRERARAEFVEAREKFAQVTADALTSEELARWVRGLSVRVRLEWAHEDLLETQASLRAAEASGQAGIEQAKRLAEQAAALQAEVERLRQPQAAEGQPAAGIPDRETIRRWVIREMTEETDRLAVTLDAREFDQRTKRLHRLVAIARIAERFRGSRRDPERSENEGSPAVVPAAGTAGPDPTGSADEPLGPATTVPPALLEEEPDQSPEGAGDRRPAERPTLGGVDP